MKPPHFPICNHSFSVFQRCGVLSEAKTFHHHLWKSAPFHEEQLELAGGNGIIAGDSAHP